MLAPVLHPFLLLEHVRQVVLLALVQLVVVLEALEVPQAPAAMDLQLGAVEEAVVLALPATRKLQTAVLLLPKLFPHAPRLASRVLLRPSLAVLTTTSASVSPQLKLA